MEQSTLKTGFILASVPELTVVMPFEKDVLPEAVLHAGMEGSIIPVMILKINAIYDPYANVFVLGTLDNPNDKIVDLDNNNTIKVQ
jgi:hypothetical protein